MACRRNVALFGTAGRHPHADRPRIAQMALAHAFEGRLGYCRHVQSCRARSLRRKAPAEWTAAPLFRECCRSFLASFKIWNEATVGGNICMSLPAGPMISLTAALEGVCTLWPRNGKPREVPVVDFVTGNHTNVLAPGELLRSIHLPATALKKTFAFRRFTFTHLGRSEVLLIGTRCSGTTNFLLTITAATLRPVQLRFEMCRVRRAR